MKLILPLTLLFLLSCLPVRLSQLFPCESIDCQSLLKFKGSIVTDPNGHLKAWNATFYFCSWPGIKCHPKFNNRVTALNLNNMGLVGQISQHLANISFLTHLSLGNNSLYGEIPSILGNLSLLTHLSLRSNRLEGGIPTSLQSCRSLQWLDLGGNNLSGSVPQELGQMQNLTYLRLLGNSLSGTLPTSLLNLTALTSLILGFNQFSGRIPEGIGALTKLEEMLFHFNNFEGTIPASIINCTSLHRLALSNNMLNKTIPADWGTNFLELRQIYLHENQLSGGIPLSFSNLSRLQVLDLSFNRLYGEVPLGLGKLQSLQVLFLRGNSLVSHFDNPAFHFITSLTNCSSLKRLHLGRCHLSGNLPNSVGHLSKDLEYFDLRNNRITGELPHSIGNLSSLAYLNLGKNFLSARIPATIGNLKRLQRLYLHSNRFLGPIPDDIGQLSSLGLLALSYNLINGSIPSSLGNLSQLRYLYLYHNRLTGHIPAELSRCSLMMLLDLSSNYLQGTLPFNIGSFQNLAIYLNVSNNHLEGEIPLTIGHFTSVLAIDLSDNNFSGVIQPAIGDCIALEFLNLSRNMLEGTIPESLKHVKYLKVLDLACNKLTGEVPAWMGQSQWLQRVNLSYNRLAGEVPKKGNLSIFGRWSFVGNIELCGGTHLWPLPPCRDHELQKDKSRKSVYFVLLLCLGCAFLLLIPLSLCARQWNSNKEIVEIEEPIVFASPNHQWYYNLTQRELEIATGGFCEANLLGKGRFGSVYKAVIGEEKTVVAAKVLHNECIQSYKSIKRECQILSSIKHRNLVKLVGAIWSKEFKAIVLQFVGNGSLEQHLYPDEGGCELTYRERLQIAIDVAHGLEYLHEGCSLQVVHCDLKPGNVLLDDDMVAHIADFGIAKLLAADAPHGDTTNETGFFQGSFGYIPPEYAQGIEISEKGDVYSFGVLILEIVTRKRPTNELFMDGLTLRKWVISAFPDHIMDVVDISLLNAKFSNDAASSLEQWCIHMLSVGLMCTEYNPQKRPPVSFVARTLENVQRVMLGLENKLQNVAIEKI